MKDFFSIIGITIVLLLAVGAIVVCVMVCINAFVYEPYDRACRDAGGIPVHIDSRGNCARPEGGWIDVH